MADQGFTGAQSQGHSGTFPLFDLPKELLMEIIYYLNNHDLNSLMAFPEISQSFGNEFALYTDAEETHFPNFPVVFHAIPGRGFVDQPGIDNTRRTRIILELNHTHDMKATDTPDVMEHVETRINIFPQEGIEDHSMFGGMTNFGMFHAAQFTNFNPKTKSVSIDNVETLDIFARLFNPTKLIEIPQAKSLSLGMCSVSAKPLDRRGPVPAGPRYKLYTPKLEKLYVQTNYKDVQTMIDFDSAVLKELNLMNITDYPVVEGRYPYLQTLKIESPEIVKLSNLSLPSVTSLELPQSIVSLNNVDISSLEELIIKTDAEKFYIAHINAPKLRRLVMDVHEIAVFKDVMCPELKTLKLGEELLVRNRLFMVDFGCLPRLQTLEMPGRLTPLHQTNGLPSQLP